MLVFVLVGAGDVGAVMVVASKVSPAVVVDVPVDFVVCVCASGRGRGGWLWSCSLGDDYVRNGSCLLSVLTVSVHRSSEQVRDTTAEEENAEFGSACVKASNQERDKVKSEDG